MWPSLFKPGKCRPEFRADWQRLEGNQDAFGRALTEVFWAQGYVVCGSRTWANPLESQARALVLCLERDGELCLVLGLRSIALVTSEEIGRFARAVAASPAQQGIVVTISWFSDAAREIAQAYGLEMYDREHLWKWIQRL